MKYCSMYLRCLVLLVVFLMASTEIAWAQFGDSTSRPEVKKEKVIISIGYHSALRLIRADGATFEEREYLKNRRKGRDIRLKVLIPTRNSGTALGIIVSRYQSGFAEFGGSTVYDEIDYIGLVYQQYSRTGMKRQHLWSLEYSLGYIHYESVGFGRSGELLTGENLGISFGGTYRYMVSPAIGIGANLHVEGTSITQLKSTNGAILNLGESDSLFRVSLGFGIDIRL